MGNFFKPADKSPKARRASEGNEWPPRWRFGLVSPRWRFGLVCRHGWALPPDHDFQARLPRRHLLALGVAPRPGPGEIALQVEAPALAGRQGPPLAGPGAC